MSGWAIGGLVRALACYVFCICLDIYLQINIRNTYQLSWAMCFVRMCWSGHWRARQIHYFPTLRPLPKMGTLSQAKKGAPNQPRQKYILTNCKNVTFLSHTHPILYSRLTTTRKRIFSSAPVDNVAKRSWAEEKTIFPEKRKLDVFSEVSNLLLAERPFQSPRKLDLFLTDF